MGPEQRPRGTDEVYTPMQGPGCFEIDELLWPRSHILSDGARENHYLGDAHPLQTIHVNLRVTAGMLWRCLL